MENQPYLGSAEDSTKITDETLDQLMGEELTDDQLLQMAEGSCSWGANCRG